MSLLDLNRIVRTCVIFGVSVISPSVCIGMNPDDGRPPEHFCPITHNIMSDPVVAADGNTYEREAIVSWLVNNTKSPITNDILSSTMLVDNVSLKKFIQDWKISNQSQLSILDSNSDFANCLKAEFERNKNLLHSSKGKHIVALLGKPGSGKSTLINLLSGKKLVVSPDEEEYLIAKPEDKTAMVMGLSNYYETLYPKTIDIGDFCFFEFPDFYSMDGTARNIVNTAYMSHIFLEAKSVRLIFVADQDQFSADRSASFLDMLNTAKNLFVCTEQTRNVVNEGLFFVTKVTSNNRDIIASLLKRVNSMDKAELHTQLHSWFQQKKFFRMMHPLRKVGITGIRSKILKCLRETSPASIKELSNACLLHPAGSLEKMFEVMMQEVFDYKLQMPLENFSDYESAIACYDNQDFWKSFDTDYCENNRVMSLLKRAYVDTYKKSLALFEKNNGSKLQAHIKALKEKVKEIEEERISLILQDANPVSFSGQTYSENNKSNLSFNDSFNPEFYNRRAFGRVAFDIMNRDVDSLLVSRSAIEEWQKKPNGSEDLSRRMGIVETKLMENNALAKRVILLEEKLREQPRISTTVMNKSLDNIIIPEVARGHEEIYKRIYNGTLIYKPDHSSAEGKIELPIKELINPLDGVFDLSRCGDTDQYVSIATGYRTGKKVENAEKVEIWLTPHFLAKNNLNGNAAHFKSIMDNWNEKEAPVGIFWTSGNWSNLAWFDYLTTQSMGSLTGSGNLHQKWQTSRRCTVNNRANRYISNIRSLKCSRFMFRL